MASIAARPAHSPVPTRYTRDDLIRMGQGEAVGAAGAAAGPWTFVPLAELAIKAMPQDLALRFLLAANYAKLGLVTPARAHLDAVAREAPDAPEVLSLTEAIASLPEDRVPDAQLLATARTNVIALAEREVDVLGAFASWADVSAREPVFRTHTGEYVRRSATDPSKWTLWGPHKAQSEAFVRANLKPGSDAASQSLIVEGVQPPWLLMELVRATPEQPGGYQPALRVLCPDLDALFHALTLADLRSIVLDERVTWLVSASAGEQLEALLASRICMVENSAHVVTPSTAVRSRPDTLDILDRFGQSQQKAIGETLRRVQERFSSRTPLWWSNRYRDVVGGGGGVEPLRVLIPTTRYSTFLQHSASDLAEALRAVGCDVQVLIEPDKTARFSPLAFLKAIDEYDPDLVLSINFTRADINRMGGPALSVIPDNLPMVTWVQDAMPHLVRPDAASSLTEYDFIVGHVHQQLRAAAPASAPRSMSSPVLASTRKFHDGPVDPELTERYECEILCVTHHSQTPEHMVRALLAEPSASGPARKAIEHIAGAMPGICEHAWTQSLHPALSKVVEEAISVAGLAGDQARSLLLFQVAMPLADRTYRHQAFDWAARIATRRGWRLRLHGKGWQSHATLGAFARPEIAHDEHLRAAYQSAKTCLHVSIHGYLHQRVMECALSGGVPITRLCIDDLHRLDMHMAADLPKRTPPAFSSVLDHRTYVFAVDNPLALRLTTQYQRLGLPRSPMVQYDAALAHDPARSHGLCDLAADAAWLLGDLSETGFRSEAELEGVLESIIESPAKRSQLSRGIAGRVRSALSMESFAGRMTNMVRTSLNATAASPAGRGGGA